MDALLDAAPAEETSLETGTPDAGTAEQTPASSEAGAESSGTPAKEDIWGGDKFGPQVNQAFKSLKADNPEFAKQIQQIRDGYGRFLAVSNAVPNGMKDIQAWKTAVESLGGTASVSEILARMNSYEQLESKLKSGDASIFDTEDLKGGISQLAPALFARLEKDDPDAFGQMVSPAFAAKLAGTGMGDFFRSMYQAAGDNETLKQLAQQGFDWFQRNSKAPDASTLNAGKGPQDEVARLRQQLKEVETTSQQKEQERVWSNDVIAPLTTYEKASIESTIAPYVQGMKMDGPRKDRFVANINRALERAAEADDDYKKTVQAYRGSKSLKSDGAITYMKNKLDSILPQIVSEEAEYLGARAATPRAAAQPATPAVQAPTGGAGIAVRVAEQPPTSNIDYRRTTDNDLFANRAYTKDGKYVQWPSKIRPN